MSNSVFSGSCGSLTTNTEFGAELSEISQVLPINSTNDEDINCTDCAHESNNFFNHADTNDINHSEHLELSSDNDMSPIVNDCHTKIKAIRNEYPSNVIVTHLNVNSLHTKIDEIRDLLVASKFDMMVLSETKLDNSFQDALLDIRNYSMYRQDKRSNSGGLVAYVSKNVPSTVGPVMNCNDSIECMTIELNINDSKILVACMYKNPKMKPTDFSQYFEEMCEEIFNQYENVIIIGDLNFNMLNTNTLSQICPTFNLTNLIKDPTCYKSSEPTLIDVMLVSKRRKYIKGFSLDTGISDFHNLIGGVLRLDAPAPKRKTIYCRKLSNINYDAVNMELAEMNLEELLLSEHDINASFEKLQSALVTVLDKHAPKKKKVIKINDFPCMTKKLRKAILTRNQYRNKFFRHRSSYFLALYRKHRNLVTLLKREEAKKYFEDKCKSGTSNKDFWSAVKPFFSKSKTKQDSIPLREGNELITDSTKVCNIFNNFFREIGSNIGATENNDTCIKDIFDRYEHHPSIRDIRRQVQKSQEEISEFKFKCVSEVDIIKIIKSLSAKKSAGFDEIPIKFIKMTKAQIAKPMMLIANKCIQQNTFPDNMKKADIKPLYKKKDKLEKDNYRSINLLIGLSKVMEKIISKQITDYINPLLHKYLSGFRKGHGCQDVLIRLSEDCRKALDDGQSVGIVAIDLSKAFDCMPHGLLLAKLKAYGFSQNACQLLKSYLVNRLQRVKIGDTFSQWQTNIKGVPQGSILGPLLFNIFINDFLFSKIKSKVYNYADDNTLCYSSSDLGEIKRNLEKDCEIAMSWFSSNNMKANADKFQLMFISKDNVANNLHIHFNDILVKNSQSIDILGIEIDNKLNFNMCIDNICKKTSKQINALKRIKHHLENGSKKVIYNSYINSNFNYCPLIWMYSGKISMSKLEKIDKRALMFVTNDYISNYELLCTKEKQLSIYKKCIKSVAIQMFKVRKDQSPSFIQELFQTRINSYDMRDNDQYSLPFYNSVTYGKKSFRYYGSKLWNKLPVEVKNNDSLSSFKSSLSNWLYNLENTENIDFL